MGSNKPLPLPAHDKNPSQSIALPPQPGAVPADTVGRPVIAGVAPDARHSGHVSRPVYVIAAAGASLLAAVSVAVFLLCYRSSKVVTVRPWATGLSGQLQKAFVTGGPSSSLTQCFAVHMYSFLEMLDRCFDPQVCRR